MAVSKAQASATSDSNLMGAVAYLFGWISGLILYFVKPEDKFVRFHALQSIALNIGIFVVLIPVMIVSMLLAFIPVVGAIISLILMLVVLVCMLGLFAFWLFLMWKAYSGEKFMIPVIGPFVEKYV